MQGMLQVSTMRQQIHQITFIINQAFGYSESVQQDKYIIIYDRTSRVQCKTIA